jgi:hypothetical protein
MNQGYYRAQRSEEDYGAATLLAHLESPQLSHLRATISSIHSKQGKYLAKRHSIFIDQPIPEFCGLRRCRGTR